MGTGLLRLGLSHGGAVSDRVMVADMARYLRVAGMHRRQDRRQAIEQAMKAPRIGVTPPTLLRAIVAACEHHPNMSWASLSAFSSLDSGNR